MRPFLSHVILLSSLTPFSMFAATQGVLGTTSSGSVTVSITIPSLVMISALSDITLSSVTTIPVAGVTGNTTACIYSNIASPAGSYYVTASSPNATVSNFRVTDGAAHYILYSAYWNNTAAATQTTALTPATKTAQQTGGSATSITCGGTPNANFNISFSQAQVQGVAAATYTDVVTLLITPT